MGFLGASIGVLLGVGIQFLLPQVMGEFLPVDVTVSLVPGAIALGLAIGVGVAVVFALRPLLVLRRVSPLQAIRRDDAALAASRRRDSATWVVNLALVVSVLLLAIDRADTTQQGLWFAAGVGASIGLLYASAALLSRLARRMVSARWPYVVRQGVANLYRPNSQTRAVLYSTTRRSTLVCETPLLSAAEEGEWLRLHPLAREYLRARAETTLPDDDRREIHTRAWRWFAARGYPERAAQHALRAGFRREALELISTSLRDEFSQGHYGKVIEWLAGGFLRAPLRAATSCDWSQSGCMPSAFTSVTHCSMLPLYSTTRRSTLVCERRPWPPWAPLMECSTDMTRPATLSRYARRPHRD